MSDGVIEGTIDGTASSSSFDSSNSFYSTDSSSGTTLPRLSSPNSLLIADEAFFDAKYRAIVHDRINDFLAEIQIEEDFSVLLEMEGGVKMDISNRSPLCFRATAQFPQSNAESAFALFADIQSRPQWDALCDSVQVLKQIDPLTLIYHLKIKPTWPTTARDSLTIAAFRKLTDGRFVSVAWSIIDDSLCPPDPTGNFIRMHTRISANLFTPNPTGIGFVLTQLIDVDPKGSIPSFVIKKASSKSFPATMERIRVALKASDNTNFYNNIVQNEMKIESSLVDPLIIELQEIRKRLEAIETKLLNPAPANRTEEIVKWAPLAISSIALLLLVNINRKHRH